MRPRAGTRGGATAGRGRRDAAAMALIALGLGGGVTWGWRAGEGGAVEARRRSRPDIIIVLVDTLRADHLGMYGYARPTSPFLDEFARRGLFFPQNRSQAGCTFPSANSLLTGRDPSVFLGQPRHRVGLLPETTSIAEILVRAGYATVAVSASPIVRKHPSPHNRQGGFDQGFEVFDDSCLDARGACVNRAVEAALDALPAERPLFLYVHYMEPHAPYEPAASQRRRWIDRQAVIPDWVRRGDLNPLREHLYEQAPAVPWSDAALEFTLGLYDAEIASVDQAIAALFARLAERQRLEGALVAFVADHGEEFLEHGHVYHCRTVFDSSVRTPLVVSLPGVEGGRRFERPVENLDVVPTLLDYAGIDGGPAAAAFAGRSLRSVIEGRAEPGGAAGDGDPGYAFSLQHSLRGVTDGRFKLILDLASKRFSLFDLAADPGETTDVLDRHRREFRRLQSVLLDRLRRVEGDTGKSVEKAEESLRALRALGYL